MTPQERQSLINERLLDIVRLLETASNAINRLDPFPDQSQAERIAFNDAELKLIISDLKRELREGLHAERQCEKVGGKQ